MLHDAPGVDDYAAFLPEDRRTHLLRPTSQRWLWRGHRVHLLRAARPDAAVRVLLIHGAGGHGEALWPVAAQLADLDVDITAVDLPLYGRTTTPHRSTVRYRDWIDLLVDLVAAEDDGRPVLLLGGSIGGLLAVEVAARSGRVAGVAATCLLDPTDRAARAHMTRFGRLALLAMPVVRLIRGPLARLPVRISWTAPLARMGRDPRLGALCARDRRGGGGTVPLGFLTSFLTHPHDAARRVPIPVTLVHPERDAWTPTRLSTRTLATLPGPTRHVTLRECGHYPLEEPGLTDLRDAVGDMIEAIASQQS
ncbi:MAG: alpha/beta fold hydrolase [Brachybacterium sp.]|nr:alpha/beta fold hydrolase [Brachybacterium sp.]